MKTKVLYSIKETIADRAYGSGEIISYLRDNSVTTYIPLFSSRSGSSENSQVSNMMRQITIIYALKIPY